MKGEVLASQFPRPHLRTIAATNFWSWAKPLATVTVISCWYRTWFARTRARACNSTVMNGRIS